MTEQERNQEIRKLLKYAKNLTDPDLIFKCSEKFAQGALKDIRRCLSESLAIFEEPCGTCEGTGEVHDDGGECGGVCGAAFEIAGLMKSCPDCHPESQEPMCPTCKDTKEVWDMQEFGGRETGDKVPCPKCQPKSLPQFKDIIGLYADDEPESQEPAEKLECTCSWPYDPKQKCFAHIEPVEKPVSELKALIRTLKIYSETKHPVSQGFYQGLCMRAIDALEAQGEHIKLLNDCDDSSTRVIGEADEEIKDLQIQLEAETKANEILAKAKKRIVDENEELRNDYREMKAKLKEQAAEIERQKPYMRCLSSCATCRQDNVYGKTKCNCGCEQTLKAKGDATDK